MRLRPLGVPAVLLAIAVMLPSCGGEHPINERLRGREAWFMQPLEERSLSITAGLADAGASMVFKTRIVYQFQRGADCADAQPLIDRNEARLQDSIILYFADRTREDLLGPDVRYALRKDFAAMIERDLFPGGEARVRDVMFPLWQFQRVRGS